MILLLRLQKLDHKGFINLYDGVQKLREMLHGKLYTDDRNRNSNTEAEAKSYVIVKDDESNNDNGNDKIKNRDENDKYLIEHIVGRRRHSLYRFSFNANDLANGQNTWAKMIKIEVRRFVHSFFDLNIPTDLWQIIVDEYCCQPLINDKINIDNKIDDKKLTHDEKELLLMFLKCVYLPPKYFIDYWSWYACLQWYSIVILIKEGLVLISLLVCFYNDGYDYYDLRPNNWRNYQQFVSMLINFYFVPTNPLFVVYICYRIHFRSSNYEVWFYERRLKTINKDKVTNLKVEAHMFSGVSYILFKYFYIKVWIEIIICLPFVFVADILLVVPVMCVVCCAVACTTTPDCCDILWTQTMKIMLYVIIFGTLTNTVFCWINIYDGHMWIAAMGRGFMGVDQCPQQSIWSDLNFNNGFEVIVWLNRWII